MTLPHRIFTDLVVRTLAGHSDNNSFLSIEDFTDDHLNKAYWGWFFEDTTLPDRSYWKWYVIVKSPSAALEVSMDQTIDWGATFTLSVDQNTENCGQFYFTSDTMRYPDPPAESWDENLCSGKYYDGVNPWGDYPQSGAYQGIYSPALQYADRPYSMEWFIKSYDGFAVGPFQQNYFVRNGLQFDVRNITNCDSGWTSGDILDGHVSFQRFIVNFHNPVVNSIANETLTKSKCFIESGTAPVIILTGLAFDTSDVEINDPTRNPLNAVGAVWNSIVDRIDFIGQQGQGTFDIYRALGDFSVDSDTQITISNMPTLPDGTYYIRLEKTNVGPGGGFGDVESYAGDWKAAEDGLVSQSERFLLFVGESPPEEIGTIFYTKWAFKAKDGSQVFKYWAPIDVRSTDRFYDGRLISESGITRSVDDRSGLPNVSDMSIDVAADQEIRQLLAGYMLKNQYVELYFGWKGFPEAWKQHIMTMIVDDHHFEGNVLKVDLKDVSQKYLRRSIPRYLITTDEYPNAHDSAIGQEMPEAIGLCSKTDDPPGAISAHYVDTTTFQYLALRGSAHAILEVYSSGILQTEGAGNDYTITHEIDGRTMINFNSDQGDNKITFNCEGYMFAAWNSTNGYVQNPAYVLAFLFAFLAEVPVDFLDTNSIDNLATHFEDMAQGEAGYWIGQSSQSFETAIQELNFTFGVKVWPDHEGRFKFGIKSTTNYQSDIWIFEQIDVLKPSMRKENLREAINFVKAKYGFIPTGSTYSGSYEATRQAGVDDFEAVIEAADSPWKFPWTNNEQLIIDRVGDELLKRGYGVKEIHFELAIDRIFDLDIFDSFIYQNPFAPTLSGNGEQQRYYYVRSLSYNFVDNTIGVIGIDLQWLLRQCVIVGISADVAENYMDATEEMRMFGYVCDCDTGFPDGEECKKVCKCEGEENGDTDTIIERCGF
jgi:hypothetical protein